MSGNYHLGTGVLGSGFCGTVGLGSVETPFISRRKSLRSLPFSRSIYSDPGSTTEEKPLGLSTSLL